MCMIIIGAAHTAYNRYQRSWSYVAFPRNLRRPSIGIMVQYCFNPRLLAGIGQRVRTQPEFEAEHM